MWKTQFENLQNVFLNIKYLSITCSHDKILEKNIEKEYNIIRTKVKILQENVLYNLIYIETKIKKK